MKFFTCTFIAFIGLCRDKISDKQGKVNWPEMLQLIFLNFFKCSHGAAPGFSIMYFYLKFIY